MPITKPNKSENQQDFMSRCMEDKIMKKEYPDTKVRNGICSTQWDNKSLSEKYNCECLKCGYKVSSEKHCQDIKCPKCGAQMRRTQRPGVGQLDIWTNGLQLTNGAEPKADIMLFPYGEFEHPMYGKLKFDNKFFNEIIENYQANVLHVKPFMDKQHDEDKALAWFDSSPFIRPGQGLYISPDYTELGNTVLKTKTYRYFSPSWGKYKDPQTGVEFKNVLLGGAATNIPFLKTMPSIIDEKAVLDNKGMAEYKLTDLTINSSPDIVSLKADDNIKGQTPEVVNNLSKIKGDKIMKDKLIKTFGLSEDASEDTIISKVNEVIKSNEDLKKSNDDLISKVNNIEKKVDGDKALTDQLSDANKKLSDMEVKITQRDCNEAIQKALTEGKILPADKEYWEKRFMSNPKNISEDLEKMHAVIDFKEIGLSGEGEKNLSDDPGTKLVNEAKKLIAEKKAANLEEAVAQIATTNLKLVESYQKKYQA